MSEKSERRESSDRDKADEELSRSIRENAHRDVLDGKCASCGRLMHFGACRR